MMVVHCEQELAEARAFADQVGARRELEVQLEYLSTYAGSENVCDLYRDFAPHSFRFVVQTPEREGETRRVVLKGGLLYYGPGEGGVGLPQLSVSMSSTDAKKHRWEVHT